METGLRGDGRMGVMGWQCGRLGLEILRGGEWLGFLRGSQSNGMWMFSAPVGEYRMFVIQRDTSKGAVFLVVVGWGCTGVTGDQL